MNLSKLSQDELLTRCAWCHKVMPEDEECFAAGGKVTPEAKAFIAENEGKLLPLRLSIGQEIIAIVPTADSEARAEGNDIFFQACSEACCAATTAAIRAELPGKN